MSQFAAGNRVCLCLERCGTCRGATIPSVIVPEALKSGVADASRALLKARQPANQDEMVLLGDILAQQLATWLPELRALVQQVAVAGGSPAVVVKGLPTTSDVDNVAMESVVLLAMSSWLGTVFQYDTQNKGQLVAPLSPKPDAAANSNATPEEFSYHSDDAILPGSLRTRHIALLGIINDSNALTGYAPIDRGLNELDGQSVEVLSNPYFKFRIPASFNLGTDVWSGRRAVLWRNGAGEPCISCAIYNTEPFEAGDTAASEALERLKAALSAVTIYTNVGPGTLLVFDNDRGLHNRGRITGRRLVLRTYIRGDLDELRKCAAVGRYIFSTKKLIDVQLEGDYKRTS